MAGKRRRSRVALGRWLGSSFGMSRRWPVFASLGVGGSTLPLCHGAMSMNRDITDVMGISNKSSYGGCTEGTGEDGQRRDREKIDELEGSHVYDDG